MSSMDKIVLEVSAVLGEATMPIQQLLRIGRGAVIKLDTYENECAMLIANNAPFAQGEVLVQGDYIGIEITKKLGRDVTKRD